MNKLYKIYDEQTGLLFENPILLIKEKNIQLWAEVNEKLLLRYYKKSFENTLTEDERKFLTWINRKMEDIIPYLNVQGRFNCGFREFILTDLNYLFSSDGM